jgi:hypothetical protein
MRLMPTLTPTAEVGLVKTATPSKTPLPLPATPINAEETPSESTGVQSLPRGTILVIEIVIFALVGGLVYFRLLRKR